MNSWWYEGKQTLLVHMGLNTTTAHIVLGLILFLSAAIVLRNTKYAPALALGSVLLIQMANEVLDCLDWIAWTGGVNWGEALSDTGYTLALPAALALLWLRSRDRWPRAGTKERHHD